MKARKDPIFFVDIAVPRDVDPTVQTLERTFVYDIDDLQAVVERNADGRREAAEAGENDCAAVNRREQILVEKLEDGGQGVGDGVIPALVSLLYDQLCKSMRKMLRYVQLLTTHPPTIP